MKPKYTDEDIIRFLYDEMNQKESETFLSALCSDEQLWERFEHFQEVVERTAGLLYEPSDYSVNKIREYVAQTNPVHQDELQVSPYVEGLNKQQKFSLNAVLMAVLIMFGAITVSFSIYKVYQERLLQEHVEDAQLYEEDDDLIELKVEEQLHDPVQDRKQ